MDMRATVESLASIDRGSAAGEAESADWIASRLRDLGLAAVAVERFRYQGTFAGAQGALFAAACAGRLPAAVALALFELDYSGRAQPLRRALPGGEGANVGAVIEPAGAVERTLVLVAHHDAARTGLMWHPALAGAGGSSRGRPPFSLLPELAMAAIAAGPRALRTPARIVLAVALALGADQARSAVVPGASDNATGVAAVLELARRLRAEPLPGTRVELLFPGCEESGMGGMAHWMRSRGRDLDPRTSLVVGLDTLGAGEPMVVSAEGPLWRVRYPVADLVLADHGARRAGQSPPRRFAIGGWTDPALAALAGLPAISLLSLAGNGFTNYHLPADVPENVDWASVERCTELAEATAREWAG